MATKFQHLLSFALFGVAFYPPTALAEYHSEEIHEAQGLAKVVSERAQVSPEVMAAVVAKVKANPKLTQALIQANPRFKKILGLSDNDPLITGVLSDRKASPTPKDEPIPARANLPPSEEKIRLEETLTQVRLLLNSDPRELAETRRQQAYEPGTQASASSGAPTNRRLLSSLSPLTARGERGRTTPRERNFARYTNSSGGASLQASLEFNRSVRGAVSPNRNEQGYQLALRDISEMDRAGDYSRTQRNDDNSEFQSPKINGARKEFVARPVGGVEKLSLTRHQFSEFRITEDGARPDIKPGGKEQKGDPESRHRAIYEHSEIKP